MPLLYYSPNLINLLKESPLFAYKPNGDWAIFTEEVKQKHPSCNFFLDPRSENEVVESYYQIKARLSEFRIENRSKYIRDRDVDYM